MIDKFDQDWKAYTKINGALQGIAESWIDTGGGLGTRDYWVRINGVEWFISMRRSDRQIAIDANLQSKAMGNKHIDEPASDVSMPAITSTSLLKTDVIGDWCDQCGRAHGKGLNLYCYDCYKALIDAQLPEVLYEDSMNTLNAAQPQPGEKHEP